MSLRSMTFLAVGVCALMAGCQREMAHAGVAPGAAAVPVSAPAAVAASAAVAVAAASAARAIQADPQAGDFTIVGSAPGLRDGAVVELTMMASPDGVSKPARIASATVQDHRFTIKGHVDVPQLAALTAGDHLFNTMVLEKGAFEAVVSADAVEVRGGTYHERLFGFFTSPAFVQAQADYQRKSNAIFKGVKDSDERGMQAARAKLDKLPDPTYDMRVRHAKALVHGDGSPMLRLLAFSAFDEAQASEAETQQLLDRFEAELGPHPQILQLRKTLALAKETEAAEKTVGVGSSYKDITVWDADGKAMKLSDVVARNQLVLLDFWASWCGPCRGEFPHLAKTYAKHRAQGFEIFAVSLDDDAAAWKKALAEEKTTWLNLSDRKGMESDSAKAYGVGGLPANFLIARDGKILARNAREWDIERVVSAHLTGTGSTVAKAK